MDHPLVLDLDLVQIHLWTVFLLGSIFGYMKDNFTFLMEDIFLYSVCVCVCVGVHVCVCVHVCMRSSQMVESSGLFVALCFGLSTWFAVPLFLMGIICPSQCNPCGIAHHTDILPPTSHASKPQTPGRLITLPQLLLTVIHPMDSHLPRRGDFWNWKTVPTDVANVGQLLPVPPHHVVHNRRKWSQLTLRNRGGKRQRERESPTHGVKCPVPVPGDATQVLISCAPTTPVLFSYG